MSYMIYHIQYMIQQVNDKFFQQAQIKSQINK